MIGGRLVLHHHLPAAALIIAVIIATAWPPRPRQWKPGKVKRPSIGPTARNPWSKRSSKTPACLKQIYTGDDRIKFLPKSIINLPGENVIVPSHLTGGLPGDIGFDPLNFGAQSDLLKFRERELINGRWAMLGRYRRFTSRVSLQVWFIRRRYRSTLVVYENRPRRCRRMAAHVHGFGNPVGSLLVTDYSFAVDVHRRCCAREV